MDEAIDLLVLITVTGGRAATLIQLLTAQGFPVTEIASQVSLVEQPVASLLIGTQRRKLETLLERVRECCPTRLQYVPARAEPSYNTPPLMIEALQGGASVVAFAVEQFIQL